jgi:hypothetical protein
VLPRFTRCTFLALAALLLVSFDALAAETAGVRARHLYVAVAWGEKGGPETLRADIAGELLVVLERADCLGAAVRPADAGTPPAADDLDLRVVLSDFEEEVRHVASLAETYDPQRPADAPREVARTAVEAALRLTLAGRPEPALRQRTFRVAGAHRPLFDEDPRETARATLVEDLAERVRSFVCRGGAAKLERDIERTGGTD